MIRLFALSLAVCSAGFCQSMVNYIFNTESGAMVLYQIYSEVPVADGDKTISKADYQNNRIRRILTKGDGLPWLGFDVYIRQLPGEARFALSVDPIPGVPFFSRKPEARTLENADRVLFDVLEQPSTGKRVFDTFQVGTKGTPMQIMPLSRSVPQPAKEHSLIRFEKARLVEGITTLAAAQSVETGTRVGIEAPKAGQLLFSTEPAPGYRMEGIAEGNSLRFVVGDRQLSVICSSPIMTSSGAWYIWVKQVRGAGGDGGDLRVFVP